MDRSGEYREKRDPRRDPQRDPRRNTRQDPRRDTRRDPRRDDPRQRNVNVYYNRKNGHCTFWAIGVAIAIILLLLMVTTIILLLGFGKDSSDQDKESGPVTTTSTPTDPPEEVCVTRRTTSSCSQAKCEGKYRTYDGTCNNQRNPLWGASEIPFKRLIQPIYEDRSNAPVGWDPYRLYNGYRLPNAREVSHEILSTPRINPNPRFTDLMMVWGQYLDHDIDQIPKTNSLCTETCTQKAPYCFPVLAPENDPRLDEGDCIPLTRSTRVCDLEPREQLNSITAYLDAGVKYGSTEDRALALRDLTNENGHMKEGVSVDAYGRIGKPLLPFNVDGFPQGCNKPLTDTSGTPCFFSGDVRANEHLGLMALHTVWNREHNRIADELKIINPLWNGETLYQESRKIVGALHQKITFEHWLPRTVGDKGMELLGEYYGYNPYVDPSVGISFATASFRFGHAQISPTVIRLGSDFREAPYGNLPLHETAFCPAKIVYEGSIDPVLRGMFGTALKDIDPQSIMAEEITEALFGLTRDVALDLASLNIQRGREHGLPGYNEWRRYCNLPVANSFDDLAREITDPYLRQKLRGIYGHPSNMDLFVAGLVEDPWYDSLVGPTFTCLIVEQFRRLRDGDRYWYENPGVFTEAQLDELKKHSLARVFCDSGDYITEIQHDVFDIAVFPYDYNSCDEVPYMHMSSAWKDTGSETECPTFVSLPTPTPDEVCLTPRKTATCSQTECESKYRTHDGTCNNQRYPLWGASEIPFKRLVQPIYEDGVNTPVGWDPDRLYNGHRLPNPREVSHEVMSTSSINQNSHLTDLMMVWGQYLDHDIDQIPKTNSLCTETCAHKLPYCFPILAPENDPRLDEGDCIPLTRSTRVCGLEPREQLNSITAYLDAGVKYGSTEDRALALRDLTNENGHMKEGASVDAYGRPSKPLLPFNVDGFPQGCNKPLTDTSGTPCFFSGDVRANEHLGLMALHTIWNREHNRIADELKIINPLWNGDTLYQESRKIVGALHQKITYEHWLPKTIGNKGIEMLGEYYGYNPYEDASVSISFATATFRFGHAQISPTVIRLGSDFREAPYGNLPLHETAFCPAKVVNEGGIDPILRGMYGTPLKDINPQNIMTEEITESLFQLTRDIGLDLASINIQRGREHGLAGYNEWRRFCNLPVANSFDDLAGEISDPYLRQKLQELYGHPSNVDLFVGGLAEDPWYDSLVGPTFTCLIVEQFRRLRDGDRYWYENPGVFTTAQLAELKKHSLARVLCDSGDDITEIQDDVFQRATYPYDYKSCSQIPYMDLSTAWKDTKNGRDCPTFPVAPPPIPDPEEVCLTPRTTATCSQTECERKYRTHDGTCNNQRYPLYGASEIPFKRLIDPIYEDGHDTPLGWDPYKRYNGYSLPNAREVSHEIMRTSSINQNLEFTDLMMVWGQYLDHDIDQIPKTNSLCTETCQQKAPYCFPVLAPENDPRLDEGDCIPLTRSTRVCDLETRQQLNSITAYLDAGVKYGSTEDRALALRDLTNENGHMKEGLSVDAYGRRSKPLLPFNVDGFPQGCNKPLTDTSGTPCFFSGDVRANEHLGLMALHTIWNREHNRIADELKIINPLWNGDTLYQESRKIVGALHQKITFEHWLPRTVGDKGMELLGDYNGYNPYVDASVSISFATATFRFGHAQISPTVIRLGSDFREAPYGNLPLHETAFCPAKVVNEGGIDPILRGMYGTPLKDINPQNIMTEEITESLFQLTRDIGLDLASINIQRGRDHGLIGYNEWRRFCNLPVVYTFDDLAGEISDPALRQKLKELYGHPSNVDLFVGGLAEDPWYDSLVGPTFTCLIVEQFRRLRDGDRFWYENPGIFTPAQLSEIKKHSLGRVICDSSDNIYQVQDDVFDRANYPYDYNSCHEVPSMELSAAWTDSRGGIECPVFPDLPPVPPTPAPEEVCLTPRTAVSYEVNACTSKYRSYDGTCNNHQYTLWGASEIPFKRLLESSYEDGRNTPIGWDPNWRYNGYPIPNARKVSQEVMSTPRITHNPSLTDLMMVWGQYIDHDIDQIPKTNSLCTERCTQKSPYCFPIFAPENDPRLYVGDCIALTRSTRVCDLEPRQQLNSITSYIDAGVKYGSTEERALALRDLSDESGHMKEGVSVNAYGSLSKPLLPFNVDGFHQGCNKPRTDTTGTPCFFSGDVRANEHLGLTALHTIWNREHNRIADELKIINPQWNGETLYQESRKIVGALHQMITYESWLPKTVGTKGIELLGRYYGYRPNVDVSVSISFATASFRFGHAQISPTVIRLGSNFLEAPYGNLPLHETAFCPAKIVNEGSVDPVLRGMFGTPLKDINPQTIMTEEITESLFGLTRDVALDLASLNIQRGREHGLPGYNDWRRFCNLPVANSFDDLAGEISDPNLRQKLQELYGHPSNVDLFVGGLAEDPWYDSLVGPTFTCLIVEQFQRLRDGDRFWYENPGVFTTEQLAEIKRHSLSRVICDSSDGIELVQEDVFVKATYPFGYKSCQEIPGMNLEAWRTAYGNVCP